MRRVRRSLLGKRTRRNGTLKCTKGNRILIRYTRKGAIDKIFKPLTLKGIVEGGIKRFYNTCFINSAIMFLKNIPGLRFRTSSLERLYESPPERITEDMVRCAVSLCSGMEYGRQEDSMEFLMKMCEDVSNGDLFLVRSGIRFFLNLGNETPLPLLSDIDESSREWIRTKSESVLITGLKDGQYDSIQDTISGIEFDSDGPTIDYSDRTEFSPMDFVEDGMGNRINLEDIFRKYETTHISSCTKPVYLPDSEYVIVHLNIIDSISRRKLNVRFRHMERDLIFRTGGYKPISFTTHIGKLDVGHYINYSLKNGLWYEFDDDKVRKMGRISGYVGTPYYVLYKRNR